ncbi:Replication polyprotein [Gossypium arboreum]|uniref:Replication polyprotein n=1 Tax=Gossypium arboreum TaxID=29729 RepID=A0A0B0N1Y4_GOSAR|nr:Replication polyprotein [Gossypium arboreum]
MSFICLLMLGQQVIQALNYNSGDYQTAGGYPNSSYTDQTTTWNGSNYANYTTQHYTTSTNQNLNSAVAKFSNFSTILFDSSCNRFEGAQVFSYAACGKVGKQFN